MFEHLVIYDLSKNNISKTYLSLKNQQCWMHLMISSGGRLNKKDGLTRYGDSHVKDKTS